MLMWRDNFTITGVGSGLLLDKSIKLRLNSQFLIKYSLYTIIITLENGFEDQGPERL